MLVFAVKILILPQSMNIRISRNGQEFGPYTMEELTQYVNEGSILPDDYAYDGMEWITVTQLLNDPQRVFSRVQSITNTATISHDFNSSGSGDNLAVFLKILKWGVISAIVFFGIYHASTFVLKNTYVKTSAIKKDPSYNPPEGAVEYGTLKQKGGVLYEKGSDDLYSGVAFQLYKSGKKKIEGNFEYGLRNGYEVSWHETGQEKHRATYINDRENGEMITYHKNGEILMKAEFQNGKMDGLVAAWYENGMERFQVVVDSDIPNGIAQYWYENGQMLSDGRMKEGKPDGALKAWHENGNKWFEANDIDGKDLRTALLLNSEKIWNKEGELVDATSLEGIKEIDSYLRLIDALKGAEN